MIRPSRVIHVAAALALSAAVTGGVLPAHAADVTSDGQWYHAFLRTDVAHAVTTGEGITVAIIDSGVDAQHPDLIGSVLPGADFSSAGPGNGQNDASGHGTGMAGLVAAHGRVKGISPGAKILPIRAMLGTGAGAVTEESILWAVEHGADVISVSVGRDFADPLVQQAIEQAIEKNVVVVAAAGNRPGNQQVMFPAAFPGVIAVAALDKNGELSSTSVSGPQITIAAPGDDISVAYRGAWGTGSGTSNATAIVAGAVALIRAEFPELSAVEVVRRLTATAVDKGPQGRDEKYGYGVIDLLAALTADLPAASSTPTATAGEPNGQPDDGDAMSMLLILGAVVVISTLVLIGMRSRRRG